MRFICCRRFLLSLFVPPLLAALLSGCGATPAVNQQSATAKTPYQMLLPDDAITSMLSNCTNTQLGYLNGSKPFVIMQETEEPYSATAPDSISISGWSPQYLIRFYSEEDMAIQFSNNEIPSYVTWIMYDNEANITPPTPTIEQNNVAQYVNAAATLVHSKGLKLLFTGGLAQASQKSAVWATASSLDAYDLQTQTDEDTNYGPPSDYWTSSESIAANFLANKGSNSSFAFTAGFGNWDGTNILPVSEIERNIESLPTGGNPSNSYLESSTNIPIWANFGPHGSNPSNYPELCAILSDTITMPPAGATFH